MHGVDGESTHRRCRRNLGVSYGCNNGLRRAAAEHDRGDGIADAIKTAHADARPPEVDRDERLIVSVIGFLSMVGGVALIIRRLRT